MKLRVLIASLMLGVAAFAADNGAELFQKAVTQERAAGNLEEAIKLYQRIATEFASDRALAAKALVQEARCYEKLGQDKALKLYEQVARDFRDQREPAATASARLATLREGDRAAAPTTMTQRKIEGPSPSFPPSPSTYNTDGQRAVYKDQATGALMISDLAGRDKRLILRPKTGVLAGLTFVLSRNSSMVRMILTRPDGSRTNAVIKTDGTGYREIGGDSSCPPDWSWDNRYLLVCQAQPDGARLLLRVSVADGEILKLRETDGLIHVLSPDGRFIAYVQGLGTSGKILVVPSQGGQPQLASDNAKLIDWTRGGRYLAIAIDRSGSEALYLLPIKDGEKAGEPVFVRYGSFSLGRTIANGALVYMSIPPGGSYPTWFGTLDSDGQLGGWKQLSLSGSSDSSTAPTWSPDSSQVAYVTANQAAGQNSQIVRVRNLASGEERELYRGGADKLFCLWAAQHPNLFCEQYTPQNTTEVLSISIDSSRVERLGSLSGRRPVVFRSPDDRAIYMQSIPTPELIRYEISTQKTTTLDRSSGLIQSPGVASPDERWIARRENGKVEIRPMSGGDWNALGALGNTTQIAFTPDGNWLLYHDVDVAGKQSLFRVATAGGQPERLGDFPSPGKIGYLWISPDGRKIIADARKDPEVWMLENFEPQQQASK